MEKNQKTEANYLILSINYVYKELSLPYAYLCKGIFLINATSMYNIVYGLLNVLLFEC